MPALCVDYDFPLEIQKSEQIEKTGDWILIAYAATSDFDLDGDIIIEEALQKSKDDLLHLSTVLFNHDQYRPIGQTIETAVHKDGLWVKIRISKAEAEIWQKIQEGVLNKLSIKGRVLDNEEDFSEQHGRKVNFIKEMKLLEVSIVSVPANSQARALSFYVAKAFEESRATGGKMPNVEEEVEKTEVVTEEVAEATGETADEKEKSNENPNELLVATIKELTAAVKDFKKGQEDPAEEEKAEESEAAEAEEEKTEEAEEAKSLEAAKGDIEKSGKKMSGVNLTELKAYIQGLTELAGKLDGSTEEEAKSASAEPVVAKKDYDDLKGRLEKLESTQTASKAIDEDAGGKKVEKEECVWEGILPHYDAKLAPKTQ